MSDSTAITIASPYVESQYSLSQSQSTPQRTSVARKGSGGEGKTVVERQLWQLMPNKRRRENMDGGNCCRLASYVL